MADSIYERIAELETRRRRERHLARIADALICALRIPDGAALAPWLAVEPVRTNREAVIAWLRTRLADPELDLSRVPLLDLIRALRGQLDQIEEAAA